MASKIQDVWPRYIPVFRDGHDGTVARATPIYDSESGSRKLGSIPKDADVHYLKGDFPQPPSRMEVLWYPNSRADEPIRGWINLSAVKKPTMTRTGVKVSMKPQDFPGIGGVELAYSAYLDKIKEVVLARDMPIPLKNYLIQLIEYCDSHSSGDRADLIAAYRDFAASDAFDSLANIQKDFSELMAPICVLERGQRQLASLGFAELNKGNAIVFVPTAGNYPLIDFIIKDTSGREYPFSVKVLSKTTNVIKPQDLMEFVDDNPRDPFIVQFKRTPEYEVLRLLGQTDKGVAETSFETIKYLAQTQPFSSKLPSTLARVIPDNLDKQRFTDAVIDANREVWNEMYDEYYREGRGQLDDAGLIRKNGKYNQLSYLMQVAIAKISQDRSRGLNYLEIVRDFLMEQVAYYKFKINNNGMPEFKMENKFHNEFDANTKFVLRAKSSKGSPINDRLGVQP